jgi:chromosome partitioning protein
MRFLDSLGIPIIGVLRDSQNFVRAAEEGIGVCEMQMHRVRKEMEQLDQVVAWLDDWRQRRRDTAISQRATLLPEHAIFQNTGFGSG